MKKLDHIALDVETKRSDDEVVGGFGHPENFGLACCVVYDFNWRRNVVYGPDDVDSLQSRIRKADRISGVNIWTFDLPVIFKSQTPVEGLRGYVDDLLLRIWHALGLDPFKFTDAHHGCGLGAVAGATIGVTKEKEDESPKAPLLWQQGRTTELHSLCLSHVSLCRDLLIFAERYGYVVVPLGPAIKDGSVSRTVETVVRLDMEWRNPLLSLSAISENPQPK